MSAFTAPEDGWCVLDPSAEGGARRVEDGVQWSMDSGAALEIPFSSDALQVEWRER